MKLMLIVALLICGGCEEMNYYPVSYMGGQEELVHCSEALEAPGIYAARLRDKELDDYQAVVDCYCNNKPLGICELGLVSNQMIINRNAEADYSYCQPLVTECRN